jgi:UDP-N-acetylglucosamine 4,6-dehydratase
MVLLGYFAGPVFYSQGVVVPRSTPFIFFLVVLVAITSLRVTVQWLAAMLLRQNSHRSSVLIYGAGTTGVHLARALEEGSDLNPVAFLDDDRNLVKNIVGGRMVYSPRDVGSVIRRNRIEQILLAIPSASRRRQNDIIAKLEAFDVQIRTVPSMQELASGVATVDQLRHPDVKDILGRDTVEISSEKIQQIVGGNCVLITGAGGSIGSELARQILDAGASSVVLYDQSELALYNISQELKEVIDKVEPTVELHSVLGSVCDEARLMRVVERHKPVILFHAAAYKHVPLVELNTLEGIRNNVVGTQVVAEVAGKMGIQRAVLVSTDKAVRPTSVMGATKRLAELIFQDTQKRFPDTIFSMVRFGNVLGSSGSVVPLFEEQIRNGGPITITDPDITRYFMTIPEAAQLVIQAGSIAEGGDLLVLDMGNPVKIVDMARNMIKLSGLEVKDDDYPLGDIELVFTGLRPGEKLYEELLVNAKEFSTIHPKIKRAIEQDLSEKQVRDMLERLTKAIQNGDASAAKCALSEVVEGYGA